MDYYKELGLEKETANNDSITIAFRKLALQFHPFKNTDKLAQNQSKFNKVCEAYDVLGNQNYKAVYDKYGLDGLKRGVKEEGEGALSHTGYLFDGNGYSIFQRVFGVQNPFGENFKNPDEIRLVDPQPARENEP